MLPIAIGAPNNGGAVVTAGGLVFIAAATDNLVRAIDIDNAPAVTETVGDTAYRLKWLSPDRTFEG